MQGPLHATLYDTSDWQNRWWYANAPDWPLEASRSAYTVGRIEFLSLLDSQVRLLGAELRLVRARADKRVAFAALESASGEKLR